MDLITAIKTGLPIKRPDWRVWVAPSQTFIRNIGALGRVSYLTKEDALATDWEAQQPQPKPKPVCCCHCCHCSSTK